MTDLPDLKVKALVSFPADVHGGIGIAIAKNSGVYTIDLDYSELAQIGAIPPPSLPTTFLTFWESVQNTYRRMTISDWQSVYGGAAPPASLAPLMDGIAAVGASTQYARGDHVHPTDTSRVSVANVRERLSGPRTYYVRQDGNDSNSGLANDSSNAFLHIQTAINTIRDKIDACNNQIIVQVADGTWTENVRLYPVMGSYQNGSHVEAILRGNLTSLGNVKLNTTNANCIDACNCWFPWRVEGFEFGASGTGSVIVLEFDSKIYIGNNRFTAVSSGVHISLAYRSIAEFVDNYQITGSAASHIAAQHQSQVLTTGVAVTLTGTPAFSNGFVGLSNLSFFVANGATYTGTATGSRYYVILNSVIDTQGKNKTSYFPGNSAGTEATGGLWN